MTVPPFENRDVRGRILVLEHPSVLREIHQLFFRSAGYATVACDTPAQAAAEMDANPFDLIVLDPHRKEFIAADFIAQLRRYKTDLPILAVAWHADNPSPCDLTRNGISAVLDAPVNPTAVIHLIDALLGLSIAPSAPKTIDALVDAATLQIGSNPESAGQLRASPVESFFAAPPNAWTSTPAVRSESGASVTS